MLYIVLFVPVPRVVAAVLMRNNRGRHVFVEIPPPLKRESNVTTNAAQNSQSTQLYHSSPSSSSSPCAIDGDNPGQFLSRCSYAVGYSGD